MKWEVLIGLLVFCCLLQAGCASLSASHLESRDGVHLINPNEGPYLIEVVQRNDGRREFFWEIDSHIKQEKPCKLKYHSLYSKSRFMVVDGSIQKGPHHYPVVLDTGASQAMFVKDVHVLDNDLSIYPMTANTITPNGYGLGLCHLPELQIGNVAFINWPCLYLEQQAKLRFLGLSIANSSPVDNSIILGLPALREFSYIIFDSLNKEVELSHDELFQPDNPQTWEQYPISIEEDFHGNAFLFVRIPVAGRQTELQFDSGSGRGLALAEELWGQLHPKIPNIKLSKGTDIYPYIGRLACKRGIISKLQVGNRTITNAEVSIFPSDSPLVENCDGLLGMQYFQDAVIVLDFSRNLMWIKGL